MLRHRQTDGNPLIASSTKVGSETTLLAAEKNRGYGKKDEDWAIRSQAPKPVLVGHGEGSESRRWWVTNDGLANLM